MISHSSSQLIRVGANQKSNGQKLTMNFRLIPTAMLGEWRQNPALPLFQTSKLNDHLDQMPTIDMIAPDETQAPEVT